MNLLAATSSLAGTAATIVASLLMIVAGVRMSRLGLVSMPTGPRSVAATARPKLVVRHI